MSKIGRKPIDLGSVKVNIAGQEVHYEGKHAKGIHVVPDLLKATIEDQKLLITAARKTSDTNRLWGLHRALLANKITGAETGFQKVVKIVGLGFKAIKKGSGLEFSLGYSHKIDFSIPQGITVEIDKTGQLLTIWSNDKELLGLVCSKIRALRPPEPYKGTGIYCGDEVIVRKAGKAKA
ncbi:TPA: 50S ribosomal protein L6 [Candidatus Dependentiae bacterium]|nr:MAG: 50S ribosomal protein L6 [candidate division TM6 bacterium GW2011_GWF2_43_87]HBL98451.1 50S ribosomal protein L6 [Candidatus Dependentiae bacterium]